MAHGSDGEELEQDAERESVVQQVLSRQSEAKELVSGCEYRPLGYKMAQCAAGRAVGRADGDLSPKGLVGALASWPFIHRFGIGRPQRA